MRTFLLPHLGLERLDGLTRHGVAARGDLAQLAQGVHALLRLFLLRHLLLLLSSLLLNLLHLFVRAQ